MGSDVHTNPQVAPHAVVGLYAHVDAGKTTLAEALLYRAGVIRSLGRVDKGDAYLDFDPLERSRGITIWAKQAVVENDDARLMFVDAPGHVDFAPEAERSMQVADIAVLVVAANEGVTGHTKTLWHLLEHYGVPVIVFANKTDLPGVTRAEFCDLLRERLGPQCVDASDWDAPQTQEALATTSEQALDEFFERGAVSRATALRLVADHAVVPCLWGSALRLEGVDALLDLLAELAPVLGSRQRGAVADAAQRADGPASQVSETVPKLTPDAGPADGGPADGSPADGGPAESSARVYKVSHDARGERVSWLKVIRGTLEAKKTLVVYDAQGRAWTEKPDQLRIYNGAKFEVARAVPEGWLCAATGLLHTLPGTVLGSASQTPATMPMTHSAPVLDYRVMVRGAGSSSRAGGNKIGGGPTGGGQGQSTFHPTNSQLHDLEAALRTLADEDPLLGVAWDEEHQELRVRLMGTIQQEVVAATLRERYGLDVEFSAGSVLYKETLAAPARGVGHFEPLRHYAEVHLLLEPAERGAGMEYATVCSEDVLDRNWQRLILANVQERTHRGVLVGAPLTDVRITLLGGRAHPKHTEGGDFRQATYRAVRQALMQARDQCVLLEPWYAFELELPANKLGRALNDLTRLHARFEPPERMGDTARVVGAAPVATLRAYALDVAAYTSGAGSLHTVFLGYEPCHNADEIVEQAAYNPEADLAHTPDSVFCSHGAGYTVKWYDVPARAHVDV